MKKTFSLILFCVILSVGVNAQNKADYPIAPVPFTDVKVEDNFWAKRIETNTKVTIPIAFSHCVKSGRVSNFQAAADVLAGNETPKKFFSDAPFDDSDLYKVIEGAAYSLSVKHDKKLEAYCDSLIDIIGAAQESDGYLYTYRTIMRDSAHLHPWVGENRWVLTHILSCELYNVGHMYEGAVAYYQATGKRKFLDIALRNADLIIESIGWDKYQTYPGHQEIEIGLAKLYRITGEKKYLDQAKYFLDVRGRSKDIPADKGQGSYDQSHKPVTEQEEAVGHSVRAAYMFTAMADVAALTGSDEYVKAIKKLWKDIVYSKLYITGGIGAAGGHEGFGAKYELPNPSAYCETCAAIANVFWNERLFLMEGDAKYIDVLERSLYNNVLSGVSVSGDRFFYPNPLESPFGRDRSAWFGCACCPSNIARFIPAVPGYIYAVKDNDVYMNLYIAGQANLKAKSTNIELIQKSNMPWEGLTELTVNPAKNNKKFNLKIRIPGWANGYANPDNILYSFKNKSDKKVVVKLNGEEISTDKLDKGYLSIDRKWRKGDKITIELPIEVQRVVCDERVVNNIGKVALQRGPIMYCSEGVDFEDKNILNLVLGDNVCFEEKFENNLLGGMITLNSKAKGSKRTEESVELYDVDFKAIPYYGWAQRERTPMVMWYASSINAARPKPTPTIASESKMEGSVMNASLEGIRDQILPSGSDDKNNVYFHWWPLSDTTQWISYTFDKPYTISESMVFWFDDGISGACRTPESWKLYYKETADGAWKEVQEPTGFGVEKNMINITKFKPVKAVAAKMEVKLPKIYSSGLHEWIIK